MMVYLVRRTPSGIDLHFGSSAPPMGTAAIFNVLLILFLGVAGFAQKAVSRTHRPTSDASLARGYLTSAFDIDSSDVGPRFRGHDIVGIINRLRNYPALAEKSEFESSREYDARKATVQSMKIVGDMIPDSHFAFVVEGNAYPYHLSPTFDYDADAQLMKVTLWSAEQEFHLGNDVRKMQTVSIHSVSEQGRSYLASNAFGATVQVSNSSIRQYGLSFEAESWVFRRSTSGFDLHFEGIIRMSSDDARRLRPNLEFLIVCKLTDPWYLGSLHTDAATFDFPEQITIRGQFLQAAVEQLWVVDRQTGNVIAKFK